MDAGDIEDDGADDDQAKGAEARQDEEQTADDFQKLHELKVARGVHGADEGRGRGTLGREIGRAHV